MLVYMVNDKRAPTLGCSVFRSLAARFLPLLQCLLSTLGRRLKDSSQTAPDKGLLYIAMLGMPQHSGHFPAQSPLRHMPHTQGLQSLWSDRLKYNSQGHWHLRKADYVKDEEQNNQEKELRGNRPYRLQEELEQNNSKEYHRRDKRLHLQDTNRMLETGSI